jgi:hypothetical protein
MNQASKMTKIEWRRQSKAPSYIFRDVRTAGLVQQPSRGGAGTVRLPLTRTLQNEFSEA